MLLEYILGGATAAFLSGYLIYALSTLTHLLFLGWMVLGLIIYFAYSSKHSMCSKEQ